MALSKLEPDAEKVEEVVERMREIIETTWLRDPKLNKSEREEFAELKKEIEDMGLTVTWKTDLVLDRVSPQGYRLEVEVSVWKPKNTTLH